MDSHRLHLVPPEEKRQNSICVSQLSRLVAKASSKLFKTMDVNDRQEHREKDDSDNK